MHTTSKSTSHTTSNTTSMARRAITVSLLAVAAMTVVAHPTMAAGKGAKADPGSIPTGAEQIDVQPQGRGKPTKTIAKGQKAIDKLGARLDKVATDAGVSKVQLKEMLLEDTTLEVTDSGNLQVGDTLGSGGTGATVTTGSSNTLIWPVGNTLFLHSRASSPLKIYLDFNGNNTVGTQWNSDYGLAKISTPVWGRDNDSTTFNTSEAAAIQQAFASVSEDFAPFNVDVTTQDPGVEGLRKTSSADTAYGIRVVVGRNTWMPVNNSGYAKFYSFVWNTDTPAFCFADAGTPTKQIAECISHETGHTVGLLHDGQTINGVEYYPGHGTWAPIMGNSYGRPVTQWSRGQYPYANNTQDDLTIIGSYLGWVADDYVGTTATTATLPAGTTRSGRISWGSGEYDAFKFSLTTTRSLNIQTWEAYQAVDPNLNMRMQLTNSAGTVITTSSPSGNTRTNTTVTLKAGTYYVFLDGVGEGNTTTGYTNYGSMGYYNVLLQFV